MFVGGIPSIRKEVKDCLPYTGKKKKRATMEHYKGLCFFYSFLSSIVERPVYIHSVQPETGMSGRARTIYQGERKNGGRVYITLLVGMIEVTHIYDYPHFLTNASYNVILHCEI